MEKPTRIAHLADIHIQDRRRDEYRAVLEKLYESLRHHAPDIIVLAGDVFDNKMRASAHNLEDVGAFLTALTGIAPVVMIPGNHDTNCMVPGSLDLLTPFISEHRELQPPRLTYWRSSGTYAAHGLRWTVIAPDEIADFAPPETEAEGSTDPQPIHICLFHDAVNGALMPNGSRLENYRLSAADFAPFDATMGGHIHLRQAVTKRMSYCGSLVQQNIGEPHTRHGYVLWELSRSDAHPPHRTAPPQVRGIDIPNLRGGFMRVEVGAAGQDATPRPLLPAPSYWEIVHDAAAPPEAVDRLTEEYAALYGAAPRARRPRSTSAEPDPTEVSQVASIAAAQEVAATPEAHEEIIREILGAASPDDASIADAVIEMHRARYGRPAQAANAGARVRVTRLEFDNMYCYGQGNVIDFTRLEHGVGGVIAPNYVGKSSLIDVLLFALYEEYPRANQKKEVIRDGAGSCRLALDFELDGKPGRIEKGFDHGRGVNAGSAVGSRYRFWFAGEERTKGGIPETVREIKSLIGGASSALASSIQVQGADITGLVAASPANRKKTLADVLALGSFVELERETGRELTALNGEAKALAAQYQGVSLDALESQRDEALGSAEDATLDVQTLSERTAEATETLTAAAAAAQGAEDAHKRAADDLAAAEAALRAQPQIPAGSASAEGAAAALAAWLALLGRSEAPQAALPPSPPSERPPAAPLENIAELAQAAREAAQAHMWAAQKISASLALAEQRLAAAERPAAPEATDPTLARMILDHSPSAGCANCERITKTLEVWRRERAPAAAETADEVRAECAALRETLSAAAAASHGAAAAVREAQSRHVEASRAAAYWSAVLSQAKAAEAVRDARARESEALRERDATGKALAIARQRTEATRQAHQKKVTEAASLGAKAARLDAQCAQEATRHKAWAPVDKAIRVLKAYRVVLKPAGGIADKLLERARPLVNRRINEALCELGAKFEINLTEEYDIKHRATPDAAWLSATLASGYQKFALSLATRLAVWRLTSEPRLDAFIIDEGFGACDETGLEALGTALESLAETPGAPRLVFVVSHIDALKARLNTALEIQTRPGGNLVANSVRNGLFCDPIHRVAVSEEAALKKEAIKAALTAAKQAAIESLPPDPSAPGKLRCDACKASISTGQARRHLTSAKHAAAMRRHAAAQQ